MENLLLNAQLELVAEVVRDLIVALACGLLISLFYRWTYRGTSYTVTFVHSIVGLSMITAVVILVIGNNLARAFGLVGALSVIRFRTAIKSTQDIVFIFFALAMGLAAGVGFHLAALAGTLVIGLCLLVLSRTNYAAPRRQEFALQFTFVSYGSAEAPYLPVLEKHCRRHELVNLRSLGEGGTLGLSFYVDLKEKSQGEALVHELGRVEGVSQVNLLFDVERV